MKITKSGFKGIEEDNNNQYIQFLADAVRHADEEATIALYKINNQIKAAIKPSQEQFKKQLIKNILSIHKLLNIKTDFSKSTKMQKIISYTIDLDN